MTENNLSLRISIVANVGPIDPLGSNAGLETAVMRTAESLAKLGHDVALIGNLKTDEMKHNEVNYLFFDKWKNGEHPDYLETINILAFASGPDIESYKYVPRFVPKVLLFHHEELKYFKHENAQYFINNEIDSVICVSNRVKNNLLTQNISDKLLKVIHNGVDLSIFNSKQLTRNPMRIMFVGALVTEKNPHLLIQAFLELEKIFTNLELHLFGSAALWNSNEYLDKDMISSLSPNIYFHGCISHTQLADEYSKSSICVIPSSFESFSLVSLEAQSCGCIPVAHDIGGVSETMRNGETGYLYSPNDSDTIFKVLQLLLNNISKLEAIRTNAQEWVQDNFSWDKTALQYQELFYKILNAKQTDNQNVNQGDIMDSKGLVSVIIPCYNYAHFLADAVESVVNQTYKNYEIIIINDGSTDNTADLANQLIIKYPDNNIRVLNQANSGKPAIARNNGIKIAAGEFILPLDADDVLPPDAIENYMKVALNTDIKNLVVFGWMQFFGTRDGLWKTKNFTYDELLHKNRVPSSSLFHKSVWENNNGYPTYCIGYEDWDYWVGAAEHNAKFICVNSVTSLYRETNAESLMNAALQNHAWHFAVIVLNHQSVYTQEEVAWAKDYTNNKTYKLHDNLVIEDFNKYPHAIALQVLNYPELYNNEFIESAKLILTQEHNNQRQTIIDESNQGNNSNDICISVIITTFNRSHLLKNVLSAFTKQSISKDRFELVIVDDGSDIPAESIVEQFNSLDINYTYHENHGLAYSRNVGIAKSKYDIIVFADDDDIPSPDFLKSHLEMHNLYPDLKTAILGKLEWDESVKVSPFMRYITDVSGEYFSFANMVPNHIYDVWKWWGGLISCKKKLLEKFDEIFDVRFRFGYEDTDLAIRMLNDNIKIVYSAEAISYIIKPVEFEEFLTRRYKQGQSLNLLQKKHGEVVTQRYFLQHVEDEYEVISTELSLITSQVKKLEDAINKLPIEEQYPYLVNNPEIGQLLFNLYTAASRGYLLKGYTETERNYHLINEIKTDSPLKLRIGLHAQTLHRGDKVVGGSEITTKGLKKAFEKYANVESVLRYGTNSFKQINDDLDLVVIEGWEGDVPGFINAVKERNPSTIVLFWNLSFWGLEQIIQLPVDGFLTNSSKMMEILQKHVPTKLVMLAADPAEYFPQDATPEYAHDVVYLGMYHPHKSSDVMERMLIEASEFDFAIYGQGWDNHPELKKYWKGKLPIGHINKLYNSAKIVIGTTEDRQREAGMINNRVFESLACGSNFISEYYPELENSFGKYIHYSKKKGDTKKVIKSILANNNSRKNKTQISNYISDNHTYDHRVKQILEFYNEIKNGPNCSKWEISTKDKKVSNTIVDATIETGTLHTQSPLISVCIPTYNRAAYLEQAIQSVLNQTYTNYEILIVDDGSTDNSKLIFDKYAEHPKIDIFLKEHTNAPDTRNRLIREATGDFILWLDSDDTIKNNLIQTYVDHISRFPDTDVFYTNLFITNDDMSQIKKSDAYPDWYNNKKELKKTLVFGCRIPNPGTLIRRSKYDETGGYDVSMLRAHDYEWWVRAVDKLNFKLIDEYLVYWRWHDSNMSALSVKVDWSYDVRVIQNQLGTNNIENIFADEINRMGNIKLFYLWFYYNLVRKFEILEDLKLTQVYLNKTKELLADPEVIALKDSLDMTTIFQ